MVGGDCHHVAVVASLQTALTHCRQLFAGHGEVSCPRRDHRLDDAGAEGGRHVVVDTLQRDRTRQVVLVHAVTVDEPGVYPHRQRLRRHRRVTEFLGQRHRPASGADHLLHPAGGVGTVGVRSHAAGQRQGHQCLHQDRRRVAGVLGSAVEQRDRFGETVVVDVDRRAEVQRDRAQPARTQIAEARIEQSLRPGGVTGPEVVAGGADPAQRFVAAQLDRQLQQLGGGRRGPPLPCGVGRRVERAQGGVVGGRAGKREVACLEFGLRFDGGERTVDDPPAGGGGIGVHPTRQQRMGESHLVPVDRDDPVGLDGLEQLDDVVGGGGVDTGQQVDGGCGYRGHREQQVADVTVETPDPGAHQLGQCLREPRLGAEVLPVERACELEGVERVAAGDLADANHRRARQGVPEPGQDQAVQTAETQRTQPGPGGRRCDTELQPRRRGALVGVAALGRQDADGAPEPARDEGDHGLARRIEPLHVVDGDDNRGAFGELLDDDAERRRGHPLIGRRALAVGSEQDAVHREALQSRQRLDDRGVDVGQQIGHRRVGEHRLGLTDPGAEHPDPLLRAPRNGF